MTGLMPTQTTSLESLCAALGLDPFNGLQISAAHALIAAPPPPAASVADAAWSELQGHGPYRVDHAPYPFVTTRPLLLCRLAEADILQVQALLLQRYSARHPITLAEANGHVRQTTPLGELARALHHEPSAYALVPALAPLDDLHGADGLRYVVARLYGPRGCPWDREQTPQSLRVTLLEECHEVLEALDADDYVGLAEELGDLLLAIVAQSEMARQSGRFDLDDVYAGIARKLIRRHPHVFGDTTVSGTDDVVQNWEMIKRAERSEGGKAARGTLDGVPPGLPALAAAQALTRKAARAGFDAPQIEKTWALVHEELAEVFSAVAATGTDRQTQIEREIGDLLLALAKLAWRLDVDAESALRAAGTRFRERFAQLEARATAEQRDLATMTTAEKEARWHATRETG